MNTTPTTADDRLMVKEAEAERLTGLSAKTLKRAADRGELVGRAKVGRATRYHRPTLMAWAASKVAAVPA